MSSSFHTERFDELFRGQPVMGVFRNLTPNDAVARAHRAWDAGVHHVEIPVQTLDAIPTLTAVIAAGIDRGLTVGAGTIVDMDQLEAVASAGAGYTVSPGLNVEVAHASAARGLPHLPGVSSASEILAARREGLLWTKAFPASLLTPAWLNAMLGPFPDQRFVCTGGMSEENAPSFLHAGAKVVALSSAFDSAEGLAAVAAMLSEAT